MKTILICISAFIAFSCSSSDNNSNQPSEKVVYVSGYILEPGVGYSVVLWKNGSPTILSNSGSYAVGNDVFVSGNDVFVGGLETNSLNKTVAKIWKNGDVTNLTDGTTDAAVEAIFVQNNDVYAVGYEGLRAKVWKNGVATNLTNGSFQAKAKGIFVNGNNVYISGYESSTTVTKAKMWVNGVETTLGTSDGNSYGNDIEVNNGDIYVAGDQQVPITAGGTTTYIPSVRVWKNGVVQHILTSSGYAGFGSDLQIVNGNVITLGSEFNASATNNIKIWTNGSLSMTITDGNSICYQEGFHIVDNYTYIVGSTSNKATIWINASETKLSNNQSKALGVFVK